jgi:hypothetical protein
MNTQTMSFFPARQRTLYAVDNESVTYQQSQLDAVSHHLHTTNRDCVKLPMPFARVARSNFAASFRIQKASLSFRRNGDAASMVPSNIVDLLQ